VKRGRARAVWFATSVRGKLSSFSQDVADGTDRPYRAPELLFGPRTYDALATDLWAAGCVIAEMFHMGTPSPPYSDVDHVEERGEEDDDPLETPVDSTEIRATLFDSTFGNLGLAASIFRLRGSPNRHTWPVGPLPLCSLYSAHYPSSQEFSNLPDAGKIEFDTFPPTSLSSVIPDAPPDAVDFIDQLLALSPGRRIVAEDALDHTWFRGEGVLLPKGRRAWFGVGPDRRELDPGRIVEAVDGVSLVQLLETEFDEARQRYARIVAERG